MSQCHTQCTVASATQACGRETSRQCDHFSGERGDRFFYFILIYPTEGGDTPAMTHLSPYRTLTANSRHLLINTEGDPTAAERLDWLHLIFPSVFPGLPPRIVGYLLLATDKAAAEIPWPIEVKGDKLMSLLTSFAVWVKFFANALRTSFRFGHNSRKSGPFLYWFGVYLFSVFLALTHTYPVSCSPYLCKLLLIRVNIG